MTVPVQPLAVIVSESPEHQVVLLATKVGARGAEQPVDWMSNPTYTTAAEPLASLCQNVAEFVSKADAGAYSGKLA